ncbi:hypothetical protein PEC18_24110 [Paucibacter sp. O1-1]|nr:hypothetical protein [Paucibacter sp. O1-1]MDA3828832.1 hypothetical protein [Paucibacter sp. O1-1]
MKNKAGSQRFLDENQINNTLKAELARQFLVGPNGNVVVIASETDAFASERSIAFTEIVLKQILPLGNPVQIATKFSVPKTSIQMLSQGATHREQVVVYVSISSVIRWRDLEPGAASVETRFSNFSMLRERGVLSCLLVKPVLFFGRADIDALLHLLEKQEPDFICLGATYRKRQGRYGHPTEPGYFSNGISEQATKLAEELRSRTGIKVFHNASCVIAHANGSLPTSKIWADFPHLCVKCMDCERLYQESTETTRIQFYGHG